MRIGAITTFQNSQHPDLKETLSALHNDPTTTTVVLSGSDRNVLDDCEDVDFGRLQARDMLQHLWTGPISNASVDVVEGSRSVEVQAVGPTKQGGKKKERNEKQEKKYKLLDRFDGVY
ncbi:unnamed protein product [Malus baccata var. baccata]